MLFFFYNFIIEFQIFINTHNNNKKTKKGINKFNITHSTQICTHLQAGDSNHHNYRHLFAQELLHAVKEKEKLGRNYDSVQLKNGTIVVLNVKNSKNCYQQCRYLKKVLVRASSLIIKRIKFRY